MYFIELIWYYINKASVNRLFIIIMDNIKEKKSRNGAYLEKKHHF